jgi:hypothetical protein
MIDREQEARAETEEVIQTSYEIALQKYTHLKTRLQQIISLTPAARPG